MALGVEWLCRRVLGVVRTGAGLKPGWLSPRCQACVTGRFGGRGGGNELVAVCRDTSGTCAMAGPWRSTPASQRKVIGTQLQLTQPPTPVLRPRKQPSGIRCGEIPTLLAFQNPYLAARSSPQASLGVLEARCRRAAPGTTGHH